MMETKRQLTYPFSQTKDASIEAIVETLKTYGIVHVPDYISWSELQVIQQEFDFLLTGFNKYLNREDNNQCNKVKINRCDLDPVLSPCIVKTFSDPYMESICLKYLGQTKYFNEVMFAERRFNNQENREQVFITDHHFDIVNSLKFFLYLDDTTIENGAFCYAPKTHQINQEQARQFYSRGGKAIETPNVPLPEEAEKLIPIESAAGTMLIFDSYGFHCGSSIQPGNERRVIRFHSFPIPKLSLYPRRFSRQWLRESFLNPRRYFGTAPQIPFRPTTGGTTWRKS